MMHLNIDNRDYSIAIALSLLVIFLGYFRIVVGVCGFFHDDAIYVITGKALAQGDGYRLINLPFAPVQTKYPILYPAILSVIWKLWPSFPENLLAMQGLSLLLGSLTAGLTYLYLVKFSYCSRIIASISGLLFASNPLFLYFATQTMSEIPFAFLTILVLWAFEEEIKQPSLSKIHNFFLGILLCLPFLCRIPGAGLIIVTLLLLYRRSKNFLWIGLGSFILIFPWVLMMLLGMLYWHRDFIVGYYTDYLGWRASLLLDYSGQSILSIVKYNVYLIGEVSLDGFFTLFDNVSQFGNNLIKYFIGLVAIFGILMSCKSWRLLPCFLLSYLIIIMSWPWALSKFFIPILFFLIVYTILGVKQFVIKLKGLPIYAISSVFFCILLLSNLIALYDHYSLSKKTNLPRTDFRKYDSSWESYEAVFRWINKNTRPNHLVGSYFDTMIYLYTNRISIRPLKSMKGREDIQDIINSIRRYKINYLVKFDFPDHFNKVIDDIQSSYPDLLKVCYRGKDKRFLIYEIQLKENYNY